MIDNLRKTKIVCTIGPASESVETLRELVKAGMNCARINFSHGGYAENKGKIDNVKQVRYEMGVPLALALDTKGPEIRTGLMLNSEREYVDIQKGQEFFFRYDDVPGNNTETSISYKNLYNEVKPGDNILVADGKMDFEVQEIIGKDIRTIAVVKGSLGAHKNVNVPGVSLDQPALAQKDIDDILSGIKAGFDIIFASFIRRADDVKQIRELLSKNGGEHILIISKIESAEGINNFEEILAVSDGIMVARGDMGVEIPMEQVPIVQKRMIRRCNEVGKPVITATQMLESMIENPRPTRAEVSDVANAVYDQTGCIMLSGECAMGKYPVACVETMDSISKAIEESLHYWKRFDGKEYNYSVDNIKANISYSTVITARDIEATAIVTYANKGITANILSGLRPGVPIVAITDIENTYYQLGITQNVTPILVKHQDSINDMLNQGIDALVEKGILAKGDKVVIVGKSEILENDDCLKTFVKYCNL